jgi:hypothetical protein
MKKQFMTHLRRSGWRVVTVHGSGYFKTLTRLLGGEVAKSISINNGIHQGFSGTLLQSGGSRFFVRLHFNGKKAGRRHLSSQ